MDKILIPASEIPIEDGNNPSNRNLQTLLDGQQVAELLSDTGLNRDTVVNIVEKIDSTLLTASQLCKKGKNTTDKIFILGRDLEIADGDNPSNWKWYTLPDGQEIAKLIGHSELDITGEIETRRLTKPPYGVYFVFQLDRNHKNIHEAYGAVGTTEKGRLISLAKKPPVRKDKWYEVALGVYHTKPKGGNKLLRMRLSGIDDYTNKYGLIVKGIEIRPKP